MVLKFWSVSESPGELVQNLDSHSRILIKKLKLLRNIHDYSNASGPRIALKEVLSRLHSLETGSDSHTPAG